MTGVSNPTTDSARLVLAEAKKAFADDSLTEQGLRDILQTVKDAIASLESIKESQSATKDGIGQLPSYSKYRFEAADKTDEITLILNENQKAN
ncbi:Uncharacterised protein [Streptococcus pneumoniae]|nr:Uncharacterised protein [Streptococcus pneumoniae]